MIERQVRVVRFGAARLTQAVPVEPPGAAGVPPGAVRRGRPGPAAPGPPLRPGAPATITTAARPGSSAAIWRTTSSRRYSLPP